MRARAGVADAAAAEHYYYYIIIAAHTGVQIAQEIIPRTQSLYFCACDDQEARERATL